MKIGSCRGCGEPMGWVTTRGGKKMPLNLEPDHERGNVVISDQDGRAIAFGSHEEAKSYIFVHDGDGPYLSHFATCSARERFRPPHYQPTLGEAA